MREYLSKNGLEHAISELDEYLNDATYPDLLFLMEMYYI